jgi:hypothetical protein
MNNMPTALLHNNSQMKPNLWQGGGRKSRLNRKSHIFLDRL